MIFKVVCILSVVAMVVSEEPGHSSQYIHKHDDHAQEVTVKDHHGHHHYDHYTPPKYEFKYEVKNPHTGDKKHQHEHREGDSVKGEWYLHEPDAYDHHVHYHADKKTGFHADVKYATHHFHHHH